MCASSYSDSIHLSLFLSHSLRFILKSVFFKQSYSSHCYMLKHKYLEPVCSKYSILELWSAGSEWIWLDYNIEIMNYIKYNSLPVRWEENSVKKSDKFYFGAKMIYTWIHICVCVGSITSDMNERRCWDASWCSLNYKCRFV